MAVVTDRVTTWGWGPESGTGYADIYYQDNNRDLVRVEIHQEDALHPVRIQIFNNVTKTFDRIFGTGQVHTLLPGTDFPANTKWDRDKVAKQGNISYIVSYPA